MSPSTEPLRTTATTITTNPGLNTSHPPLLIKKLSPKARTPTRGSAFAAGYDLYSAHDTVIPARGKTLVDTELAIAVPEGTCMQSPSEPYSHLDTIPVGK